MSERQAVIDFLEVIKSDVQYLSDNPGTYFTMERYRDLAGTLPDGYSLAVGGAVEVQTGLGTEVNAGYIFSKSGEEYRYAGGAGIVDSFSFPVSVGAEISLLKGNGDDMQGLSFEAEGSFVVGAGVAMPISSTLEQVKNAATVLASGDLGGAADILGSAAPGSRLYFKAGFETGIGAEVGGTLVNRVVKETDNSVLLPDGTVLNEESVQEAWEDFLDGEGRFCFAANTPVEMADGSTKFIQDVRIGDEVLAFDANDNDGRGEKVARRVTQTHVNENKTLIDFHGLRVTPGHVFLTGDGKFKPLIEILQTDGSVVLSNGDEVRARTGLPVGSKDDQIIPVGYETGIGDAVEIVHMRAGAVYGAKDGDTYTIGGMMHSRGYHLQADGHFINAEGDVRTAFWEWGVPDDKLVAGRWAAYEDLQGDEVPTPVEPDMISANLATTLNRKQRRAQAKANAKGNSRYH